MGSEAVFTSLTITNNVLVDTLEQVSLFTYAQASVGQTPGSGIAHLQLSFLKYSPSGCACPSPPIREFLFSHIFSYTQCCLVLIKWYLIFAFYFLEHHCLVIQVIQISSCECSFIINTLCLFFFHWVAITFFVDSQAVFVSVFVVVIGGSIKYFWKQILSQLHCKYLLPKLAFLLTWFCLFLQVFVTLILFLNISEKISYFIIILFHNNIVGIYTGILSLPFYKRDSQKDIYRALTMNNGLYKT